MNRSRLWIIGSVLVVIAVVALGWFVGISPKLAEARAADQERESVVAINAAHEATVAKLKQYDDDLPALKQELAELRRALPDDAAIATLLGQLNTLAQSNGVVLTAFTASTPAEFTTTSEAPPVQEPAAPATGTGDSAAAAPPAAAPATAAAPVTIGSLEFVSIPVNISVSGDPANVAAFINSLQFGERLVLVTDLSITAETAESTGGSSTVDGLVYVLRDQRQAEDAPAATDPSAEAQE